MGKDLKMYMLWLYLNEAAMIQTDNFNKNDANSLKNRNYFVSLLALMIYEASPELKEYRIIGKFKTATYETFYSLYGLKVHTKEDYIRMLTAINSLVNNNLQEWMDYHIKNNTKLPKITIEL